MFPTSYLYRKYHLLFQFMDNMGQRPSFSTLRNGLELSNDILEDKIYMVKHELHLPEFFIPSSRLVFIPFPH